MILNGKERQLTMRQSLNGVVVQVEMSYLRRSFERVGVNGKSVVLRGNLHLSSREIHDRLIPSMVAELEFVGFPS